MQSVEANDNQSKREQATFERNVHRFLNSGLDTNGVLTVQVVVHVLYDERAKYVSLEQVQSQIDALNRDCFEGETLSDHPAYLKQFFARKRAIPNISFCLASIDPLGERTTGVNYHQTEVDTWTNFNDIKSPRTGGVQPWKTSHYLNVWVGDLGRGQSGHAQMPWGPEATDGIVIDYEFFGTEGSAVAPYNEGKTLTHLVGNYLGLFGLWGQTECGDDNVKDTPIHNAPNYGCPGYRHLSLCDLSVVEMTMNYMDNSDDACLEMFTQGQVRRMRAALHLDKRKGILTRCQPQRGIETITTERNTDLDFMVYPNPAHDQITFALTTPLEEDTEVLVYSIQGELIERILLPSGRTSYNIQVDEWPGGVYIAQPSSDTSLRSVKFSIVH